MLGRKTVVLISLVMIMAGGSSAATETFAYTGSAQTWTVPDGVSQANFTVKGPGGGGGDSGSANNGGSGGYIEATVDVSGYNSVDIYVGGGGSGGEAYTYVSGGWGYVNGQDGQNDFYAAGGGGLSAVVGDDGSVLLKAGGGGGAGGTNNMGGNGADWDSSQADGTTVGGSGTKASDAGPGTGLDVTGSATDVTVTEGGGASGGSPESDGSDGEIIVEYSDGGGDSTPPSTSDNWTVSDWQNQDSAFVELIASDSEASVDKISYRVNGGSWTTVQSSSTSLTVSNDGNNTLEYNATDSNGNVESVNTEYVALDSVSPSVSYNPSTTASGTISKDWIFVNVSSSDSNSGISGVTEEFSGSNSSFTNSVNGNYWKNHTGLSDGTYSIRGWADDSAGNTGGTSERTITIDTTLSSPDINLDSPSDSATKSNPVEFLFTPKCYSSGGCVNASLYLNVSDDGGDSGSTSSYSVSNQANFNQGIFNGLSADREDNSGVLGLGYLNGTESGQPNDNGLNGDNLIGYWRLDATSDPLTGSFNVKDYSGWNNNGTTSGEITRGTQGIFSTNSFEYDGSNDYVALNNSLFQDGPATFSVWIKTTSHSTERGDVFGLLSSYFPQSYGYGIFVNESHAKALASNGGSMRLAGSKKVNDGEWHHIAMTVDGWGAGTNMKLYTDGELEAQKTGEAGKYTNVPSNSGRIGSAARTYRPFNGRIDEARFYNRSLSTSEIKELYFNTTVDQYHEANYTSKKIDTTTTQSWDKLYIDSTVPTDTKASAIFRALDSGGSVTDSQVIDLSTEAVNHSLSVSDSEDAEIVFNGTTTNASKSWEISEFKTYYSEASGGTGSGWEIFNTTTSITNSTENLIQFNFSQNFTLPAIKKWNIKVEQSDGKTNFATSNRTITVEEDAVPPTTSDNWTISGWQSQNSALIELTCSDTDSSCSQTSYRIDGGSWTTGSPSLTFPISGDGNHTVEYNSTDTAGNKEPIQTEYIALDSSRPTVSYAPTTTDSGTISQDWIFINISASDSASGLNSVTEEFDDSNTSFSNSANNYYWENHTGLSDGTYTIRGWADDNAGNTAATSERIITVDTVKPSPDVTLDSPADATTQSNPIEFLFTPKCFSSGGCSKASLYLNTSSGVSTNSVSTSSQADFNKGVFNGASADRQDNSGTLGLGYLNGSRSAQPNSNSLNGGSLIGYWRMDRSVSSSGGVMKDYSGIGNSGTTKGVSTGGLGVFGTNSFEFDRENNENVSIDNTQALNPDELTYSIWVKSNQAADSFDNVFYLKEWSGPFHKIGFYSGGNVRLTLTDVNGNTLDLDTPGEWDDGDWHHVVGTYDGSDAKVYVDGSLKVSDSSTLSGDLQYTSQNPTLGHSPYAPGVDGWLDEFRIYNESLSASEIEKLYFNGKDGSFNGNYTSKKIDTSSTQSWNKLFVDSTVPSDTDVSAVFKSLDSGGSVVDSQVIPLGTEAVNHSLSVSDSEDAEVVFNGTSTNVTETWEINNFKAHYSEPGSSPSPSSGSTDISSISDFNDGVFNGTSADRRDNSGFLGIGYLNGTSDDSLELFSRFDSTSDPLTGDFDVKDYSGNKLNGTIEAGEGDEKGKKGVFGTNAFEFDGSDDRIRYPETPITGNEAFTISMWFNREATSFPNDENLIILDHRGTGGGPTVYLEDGSGNEGRVKVGNSNTEQVTSNLTGLNDGNWHHLVVTHDGSSTYGGIDIFIDGEVRTDSTSSTSLNMQQSNPVYLGYSDSNVQSEIRHFTGKMDEVRIYSEDFSAGQIEELYFEGQDGIFNGNYTSERIDTDSSQSWDDLYVDSTVPTDTNASAVFKALDSGGSVVDAQVIDLSTEAVNHTLSVSDSEDAEIVFNGTSTNASKTWEISEFKTYYSEASGGTSSGWKIFNTTTNVVNDTENSIHFNFSQNFTLPGTFEWNIKVEQSDGNTSFATSNRTLTVSSSTSYTEGIAQSLSQSTSLDDAGGITAAASQSPLFSSDVGDTGSMTVGLLKSISSSTGTDSVLDLSVELSQAMYFTDKEFYNITALIDQVQTISTSLGIDPVFKPLETGSARIALQQFTGANATFLTSKSAKASAKSKTVSSVTFSDIASQSISVALTASADKGVIQILVQQVVTPQTAVKSTVGFSEYSSQGLDFRGNALNSITAQFFKNQNITTNKVESQIYSTTTQDNYNQGTFSGTSADRKNNSGVLGIGYLNSTQSGQQNDNGLNNDSLIGYWRLDKTSGIVTDYSGQNNDGTANNGVKKGSAGIFGTDSFDFDGDNDYVEISHDPVLTPDKISISWWMKPRTTPFSSFDGIISKGVSTRDYWIYGVNGDSKLRAEIKTTDGEYSVDSASGLDQGEWHHFTVTYDGTVLRMFQNGEQVNSESSASGDLYATNSPIYLGYINNYDYFNGRIDEVQIYSRSLSESEIKRLYFNTSSDKYFKGNYNSSEIDTESKQSWDKLYVDSYVPSETSVSAIFKTLDSEGNMTDKQIIDLSTNNVNHSLSVSDSEDAEVVFNGTSTNATKTWEIDEFKTYYSDPGSGRIDVDFQPYDTEKSNIGLQDALGTNASFLTGAAITASTSTGTNTNTTFAELATEVLSLTLKTSGQKGLIRTFVQQLANVDTKAYSNTSYLTSEIQSLQTSNSLSAAFDVVKFLEQQLDSSSTENEAFGADEKLSENVQANGSTGENISAVQKQLQSTQLGSQPEENISIVDRITNGFTASDSLSEIFKPRESTQVAVSTIEETSYAVIFRSLVENSVETTMSTGLNWAANPTVSQSISYSSGTSIANEIYEVFQEELISVKTGIGQTVEYNTSVNNDISASQIVLETFNPVEIASNSVIATNAYNTLFKPEAKLEQKIGAAHTQDVNMSFLGAATITVATETTKNSVFEPIQDIGQTVLVGDQSIGTLVVSKILEQSLDYSSSSDSDITFMSEIGQRVSSNAFLGSTAFLKSYLNTTIDVSQTKLANYAVKQGEIQNFELNTSKDSSFEVFELSENNLVLKTGRSSNISFAEVVYETVSSPTDIYPTSVFSVSGTNTISIETIAAETSQRIFDVFLEQAVGLQTAQRSEVGYKSDQKQQITVSKTFEGVFTKIVQLGQNLNVEEGERSAFKPFSGITEFTPMDVVSGQNASYITRSGQELLLTSAQRSELAALEHLAQSFRQETSTSGDQIILHSTVQDIVADSNNSASTIFSSTAFQALDQQANPVSIQDILAITTHNVVAQDSFDANLLAQTNLEQQIDVENRLQEVFEPSETAQQQYNAIIGTETNLSFIERLSETTTYSKKVKSTATFLSIATSNTNIQTTFSETSARIFEAFLEQTIGFQSSTTSQVDFNSSQKQGLNVGNTPTGAFTKVESLAQRINIANHLDSGFKPVSGSDQSLTFSSSTEQNISFVERNIAKIAAKSTQVPTFIATDLVFEAFKSSEAAEGNIIITETFGQNLEIGTNKQSTITFIEVAVQAAELTSSPSSVQDLFLSAAQSFYSQETLGSEITTLMGINQLIGAETVSETTFKPSEATVSQVTVEDATQGNLSFAEKLTGAVTYSNRIQSTATYLTSPTSSTGVQTFVSSSTKRILKAFVTQMIGINTATSPETDFKSDSQNSISVSNTITGFFARNKSITQGMTIEKSVNEIFKPQELTSQIISSENIVSQNISILEIASERFGVESSSESIFRLDIFAKQAVKTQADPVSNTVFDLAAEQILGYSAGTSESTIVTEMVSELTGYQNLISDEAGFETELAQDISVSASGNANYSVLKTVAQNIQLDNTMQDIFRPKAALNQANRFETWQNTNTSILTAVSNSISNTNMVSSAAIFTTSSTSSFSFQSYAAYSSARIFEASLSQVIDVQNQATAQASYRKLVENSLQITQNIESIFETEFKLDQQAGLAQSVQEIFKPESKQEQQVEVDDNVGQNASFFDAYAANVSAKTAQNSELELIWSIGKDIGILTEKNSDFNVSESSGQTVTAASTRTVTPEWGVKAVQTFNVVAQSSNNVNINLATSAAISAIGVTDGTYSIPLALSEILGFEENVSGKAGKFENQEVNISINDSMEETLDASQKVDQQTNIGLDVEENVSITELVSQTVQNSIMMYVFKGEFFTVQITQNMDLEDTTQTQVDLTRRLVQLIRPGSNAEENISVKSAASQNMSVSTELDYLIDFAAANLQTVGVQTTDSTKMIWSIVKSQQIGLQNTGLGMFNASEVVWQNLGSETSTQGILGGFGSVNQELGFEGAPQGMFSAYTVQNSTVDVSSGQESDVSFTELAVETIGYSSSFYGFPGELFYVGIAQPIGIIDDVSGNRQQEDPGSDQDSGSSGGGGGSSGGGSGGGGLPGGFGGSSPASESESINVTPEQVVVKLKQGNSTDKELNIRNFDSNSITVYGQVIGIRDFVGSLAQNYNIEGQQSRQINIGFSAPETQDPGVYNGSIRIVGDDLSDYVDVKVIVQNTSEEELLDVRLRQNDNIARSGEYAVEIFNMGVRDRVDMTLTNTLVNATSGEVVHQESETLAVQTSTSIARGISVDQLSPGRYRLDVLAEYSNGNKSASTSYSFDIQEEEKKEALWMNRSPSVYAGIILGIIAILSATIYSRRWIARKRLEREVSKIGDQVRQHIENGNIENKHEIILELKNAEKSLEYSKYDEVDEKLQRIEDLLK